jgi:hypothetical protein
VKCAQPVLPFVHISHRAGKAPLQSLALLQPVVEVSGTHLHRVLSKWSPFTHKTLSTQAASTGDFAPAS